MSSSFGSESGGKGGSQDFDLNLAPIIDCFTVLITFMLVSASFLATGILSAGAEVPGHALTSDQQPPSVALEILINEDHSAQVKLTGKSSLEQMILPKDKDLDVVELQSQVRAIKTKWVDLQSITITGQPNAEYEYVIKAMDGVRKIIPAVFLGGF